MAAFQIRLIVFAGSLCGVSEIFHAFLWFSRARAAFEFFIKSPSFLCFDHTLPHIFGPVYAYNITMSFETSRLSVDTLLDLILMKLPEEARSARYCSDSEVGRG